MTTNECAAPIIEKNIKGFRTCAQTRESLQQNELIRFVADESGNIFPDISARAPGRGVWVKAQAQVLEAAIKNNAFSRSLKRVAKPNSQLIDETIKALKSKILGLIGLSRRAGVLITGFDKVEDAIKKAPPAFIIEAFDGSADGRGKIIGLSKKWKDVPIIGIFSTAELEAAIGRENIIHAILVKGQFSQNFAMELRRLEGFIPISPPEWKF